MTNSEKLSPQLTLLCDYEPPPFFVPKIDLKVDLSSGPKCRVHSRMNVVRNRAIPSGSSGELHLDLEELEVEQVRLNGVLWPQSNWQVKAGKLVIQGLTDSDVVEISSTNDPSSNHSCMGLYQSGPLLLTQMEPEGFRRLTPFLDRPDVMSQYTTTIIAPYEQYPVLLSNGNLVESVDLEGGLRQVTFEDPFPKPCYLFALVAGKLEQIDRTFVTGTGREIGLSVYVEAGDEGRVEHALNSLEKSMEWDEREFGLEYDLDTFSIVAVDRFNFGAMENKSLNIFNSSAVLADLRSTTDERLDYIERVVAHEYFHNYSGNRVTCRDWFQLTLKEGLTVYRDQEFSSSLHDRTLRRIMNVKELKAIQFPEDRGPNSHPIRPPSYLEIANFYTPTVYEKGAEVIRMLPYLVTHAVFMRALRAYFKKFDGQAITTDDFIEVIEEVSERDLSQFKRWYSQRGTPRVEVTSKFDSQAKRYTLAFEQLHPVNVEPDEYQPLSIPIKLGLVSESNSDVEGGEQVLILSESRQEIHFDGLDKQPIPSLLRDFSAPVELNYQYTVDELVSLARLDTNLFNRYEAVQRLMLVALTPERAPLNLEAVAGLAGAFRDLLTHQETAGPAFKAETLRFPSLRESAARHSLLNYSAEWDQFLKLKREIGVQLTPELIVEHYQRISSDSELETAHGHGLRALRNVLLEYLAHVSPEQACQFAWSQFKSAETMTSEYRALEILVRFEKDRQAALDQFFEAWSGHLDTLCLWYRVQVGYPRGDVVDEVRRLAQHPTFSFEVPNLVRSLYGVFGQNLPSFHNPNGSGYELLVEVISQLNTTNSQLAASMTKLFIDYPKLVPDCAKKARGALESLLLTPKLSKGVYEIANNILKSV